MTVKVVCVNPFKIFMFWQCIVCVFQEEWEYGRCLEIMITKSSKFTSLGMYIKPRVLQSWCVSLLEKSLTDSKSSDIKSHLATPLFDAKIRAETKRFWKHSLFVLIAIYLTNKHDIYLHFWQHCKCIKNSFTELTIAHLRASHILKWIIVFDQNGWMNDSMIHKRQ